MIPLKTVTFKAIILLILLGTAVNTKGESPDSLKISMPEPLPLWTLYIPGASYFCQQKYLKGTVFSALEVGGVWLGIKHNNTLKNNSSSPYYNYPLFLRLQAFQTEKLTNFKNRLEIMKFNNPDFRYHDISEKDLYLSPFKIENIVTPITGGMVLLAGIFLGIEKIKERNSISEVEEIYFINRYIHRNQALPLFAATSLAMSWGAGIGEEYICRNYLLPVLDYKYGQKKGLLLSSLTFGALHFSNLLFSEKPDYLSALIQVGEATIAGYFLGRDVQKRGYNIGPAVAAHMWYDAILMAGSFLINPENNFLGVSIKMNIN
jgi:membrane protease YdiL (CAAX protease family)